MWEDRFHMNLSSNCYHTRRQDFGWMFFINSKLWTSWRNSCTFDSCQALKHIIILNRNAYTNIIHNNITVGLISKHLNEYAYTYNTHLDIFSLIVFSLLTNHCFFIKIYIFEIRLLQALPLIHRENYCFCYVFIIIF